MFKNAVTRLAALSEPSGKRPKFYPYFYLWILWLRQSWCGECPFRVVAVDSVFNIIFKKIYSVRYMEVSVEYCGNETRHDA